ncbi:hypothetical protein Tco_0825469 [Tanacetum coccineum]
MAGSGRKLSGMGSSSGRSSQSMPEMTSYTQSQVDDMMREQNRLWQKEQKRVVAEAEAARMEPKQTQKSFNDFMTFFNGQQASDDDDDDDNDDDGDDDVSNGGGDDGDRWN